MKKIYTAITVMCLVASAVLLMAMKPWAKASTQAAIPYTIDFKVTEIDGTGKLVSSYDEHRVQSANGNWKDVKIYEDGSVHTLVCDRARNAVFNIAKDRLVYLSECGPQVSVTNEQLLQSPTADGTLEKVAGYDTVVLKTRDGVLTFYKAGALGGVDLKVVHRSPDGYTYTMEATKVTLGEPGAKRMAYPKELPVDNSFFEKRQQQLQQK